MCATVQSKSNDSICRLVFMGDALKSLWNETNGYLVEIDLERQDEGNHFLMSWHILKYCTAEWLGSVRLCTEDLRRLDAPLGSSSRIASFPFFLLLCPVCKRDQTSIIYRYIIYDAYHTSKNTPAADRHPFQDKYTSTTGTPVRPELQKGFERYSL